MLKNIRANKQKKRVLTENTNRDKMVESNTIDNTNNECLTLFNPVNKEGYDFLTKNWSSALVKFLNSIHKKKNLLPKN